MNHSATWSNRWDGWPALMEHKLVSISHGTASRAYLTKGVIFIRQYFTGHGLPFDNHGQCLIYIRLLFIYMNTIYEHCCENKIPNKIHTILMKNVEYSAWNISYQSLNFDILMLSCMRGYVFWHEVPGYECFRAWHLQCVHMILDVQLVVL